MDKLWFAPVPDYHSCHMNGQRQTQNWSTVLLLAPTARSKFHTRSGKTEFPVLCPSASVGVGHNTPPLHRVSERTSPNTSQPWPSPFSPRAQPKVLGRISQGEGQSSLCSSMELVKGGQPRRYSSQLFPELADRSLQGNLSSTDKSTSDLIILNTTLQNLFSVALNLDSYITTYFLADKLLLPQPGLIQI